MPTIAKVQVLFTLLTRDIYNYAGGVGAVVPEGSGQLHNPWGNRFQNSSFDYLLHLLYTPVVTLHNPYNVSIRFHKMKVVFSNVPFAMQIFRNGQAQTTGLVPLGQMYFQGAEMGTLNKRFGMNLKTNSGSATAPVAGSTTFTLLPGETKMFTPYIANTRTWADEYSGTRVIADWDNDQNRTFKMDAIPGWRGDGIGFDCDWFGAAPFRVDGFEHENGKDMQRDG